MSQPIKITSELEMLTFGQDFAQKLTPPCTVELIGDVGAGKTTLVRGIAAGLGVKEPVTSPSFTISKAYAFPSGTLVHYDFYRLSDPGLMSEDLAENLSAPDVVTIVEWADSVADLLPRPHHQLTLTLAEDGTRVITKELA